MISILRIISTLMMKQDAQTAGVIGRIVQEFLHIYFIVQTSSSNYLNMTNYFSPGIRSLSLKDP